ncbi:RraA family protein [uncultured Amnibacterium sp.]|uniref:RraA family protein n=1 Tax=uncultured Amnibacterium sp. TaxID=1631851 RepID=UPI0035CA0D39
MDLEGLTTAHLADGCLRLGVPVRCGPAGLRPLVPGTAFAGPAAAVVHLGSVDRLLEAIDGAAPGDVLVVDDEGRTDEACIGDLVALDAAAARLAGVVVWGLHRDTADLVAIGLPLVSLGAIPTGPLPGTIRAVRDSASVGEWPVAPGDLVAADDDGVVLVPAADAEAVVAAARGIRRTERAQADRIRAGETLRDQVRFAEYLARRSADPAYTFRAHLRQVGGEVEV